MMIIKIEKLLSNFLFGHKKITWVIAFFSLFLPVCTIIILNYYQVLNKTKSNMEALVNATFGEIEGRFNERLDLLSQISNFYQKSNYISQYIENREKGKNKKLSKRLTRDFRDFINKNNNILILTIIDRKKDVLLSFQKNVDGIVESNLTKFPRDILNENSNQRARLKNGKQYYSGLESEIHFNKKNKRYVLHIHIVTPIYSLNKKKYIGKLILTFYAKDILGKFVAKQTFEERKLSIFSSTGFWIRGNKKYNNLFKYSAEQSPKYKALWNIMKKSSYPKGEMFYFQNAHWVWGDFVNNYNNKKYYLLQEISSNDINFINEDNLIKTMVFVILSILMCLIISYLIYLIINKNIEYKDSLYVKLKRERVINLILDHFRVNNDIDLNLIFVIKALYDHGLIYRDDGMNSCVVIKTENEKLLNKIKQTIEYCNQLANNNEKKITSHPINCVVVDLLMESKKRSFGVIQIVRKIKYAQEEKDFYKSIGHIIGSRIEEYFQEKKEEETKMKHLESAKTSSLGMMAGGIAHEINNPLAILNASCLKIKSKNYPDTEKYCDKIFKSVKRINIILKSMQDLSRTEKMEQDTIEIVLSDIIEHIRVLWAEKIRNHNILFTTPDFSIENYSIKGQPIAFSQAIVSMITNSIEALKKSIIRNITITVGIENGELLIKIIDTGKGIAKENVSRIMEPFFTTKNIGEGAGLGLSLAERNISLMQGRLYLDERSKQTCFIIAFKDFKVV